MLVKVNNANMSKVQIRLVVEISLNYEVFTVDFSQRII